MRNQQSRNFQSGVFLIEALIAIVVFAVGILSMISMQAVSIAAQNDSQYRAEAQHMIDQLTGDIRLSVGHDVTTGNVDAISFATYAHQPATVPTVNTGCPITAGTPSSSTVVTDWIGTVRGLNSPFNADGTRKTAGTRTQVTGKGLPDVTGAPRVQILTNSTVAGIYQARVTICWQGPNDKTAHSHSVVAYID
jgi:type IV pilus assembly protein PilV